MLDKFIGWIENSSALVLSVGVVLLVSFLLYHLSKRGLNLLLEKGKVDAALVSTLRVLLRWTFVIITLLLVLQQMGVLQNAWAGLLAIIATIAIGFVASWSILSNVFCTLLVLIYRPFRIGDVIEVPADNVKGEVIDLNFMYTTLRKEENEIVQVPNNTFFVKPVLRVVSGEEVSLYDQLHADKPNVHKEKSELGEK